MKKKMNSEVVYIRDVPKKDKAVLIDMAISKGLSLNEFCKRILISVAKESLILEVSDRQHTAIEENTRTLYDVKKLLLEIGGETIG